MNYNDYTKILYIIKKIYNCQYIAKNIKDTNKVVDKICNDNFYNYNISY